MKLSSLYVYFSWQLLTLSSLRARTKGLRSKTNISDSLNIMFQIIITWYLISKVSLNLINMLIKSSTCMHIYPLHLTYLRTMELFFDGTESMGCPCILLTDTFTLSTHCLVTRQTVKIELFPMQTTKSRWLRHIYTPTGVIKCYFCLRFVHANHIVKCSVHWKLVNSWSLEWNLSLT